MNAFDKVDDSDVIYSMTQINDLLSGDIPSNETKPKNQVFRGVSRFSQPLVPSLFRQPLSPESTESEIISEFQAAASLVRPEISDIERTWDSVVLGQHYDLPTRLLDWTDSPFVALHFATKSREAFTDAGAVWVMDVDLVHAAFKEKLDALNLSTDRRHHVHFDALRRAARTPSDLDQLVAEKDMGPLFFLTRPPMLDERVANQASLFSIAAGWDLSLSEMEKRVPKLKGAIRRLIIRPELKWEIRRLLYRANLRSRYFFPGLGGIAEDIKWMHFGEYPRIRPVAIDRDAGIKIDFSYLPRSPLSNGWSTFGMARCPTFTEKTAIISGVTTRGCGIKRHAGSQPYALDFFVQPNGYACTSATVEIKWIPSDGACFYVGLQYCGVKDPPTKDSHAAVNEGVHLWLQFNPTRSDDFKPESSEDQPCEFLVPGTVVAEDRDTTTVRLILGDLLERIRGISDKWKDHPDSDLRIWRIRLRGDLDVFDITIKRPGGD